MTKAPSDESPPTAIATTLDEVAGAPSFAAYMGRCLYDAQHGYYASGRVTFGEAEHFWTYPQRLRPLFGWMVAEAARSIMAVWLEAGEVPNDAPLTILELGAGDGDLAADTMDYVQAHVEDPAWAGIAGRLRYVIGEVSPALRERQRARLTAHIEAGRAEVREVDARTLAWDGDFYGVVIANELIDAFPCEILTLLGPGAPVYRRHVVAAHPDGERPLPAALRAAMPGHHGTELDAIWSEETEKPVLVPLEVPLELGWAAADGTAEAIPETLRRYLARIGPLLHDLHACGQTPVELCWAPALPRFVEGLGALLSGPGRQGAAILIDYGGSSRHVLDPNASAPHLRVYGPDGERAHTDQVLDDPGRYDMTWDVDFSELAVLASDVGLQARFFGHQSALEAPPVDLWSRRAQSLLIRARVLAGETDGVMATVQAHELVSRFREAAGFRMMLLAPSSSAVDTTRLGPSDGWDQDGLATLASDVDPEALADALSEIGLDSGLAEHLKACGDPVSDLSDRRHYRNREAVLTLLRERGWLREPGQVDR